MRSKSFLFSAALVLAVVPVQAQYLGQTTIISPRPGVVVGSPTVFAPAYETTVVSPYTVVSPASPVVVRRSTVIAPTVYGAPTVVASPIVPGPVLMSPGVRVVRPARVWGPAFGPRPWGWRRW